jgi:hypothetical protein
MISLKSTIFPSVGKSGKGHLIYITRCKKYIDNRPFCCENIAQDDGRSPTLGVTITTLQREVPMALRKWFVSMVVLAVFAGFVGAPPVVWAEEEADPAGTEIVFDLAIARPLGFAGLAVGTTVFIASFPFAVAVGRVDEVAEALVVEPYEFTFVRDLGRY